MEKFKGYYKQNFRSFDFQEDRRRALLEEQKNKRALLQDQRRNLGANVVKETRKSHRKSLFFRDLYNLECELQMSEWLYGRPENLNDWMLVPCPKGKRNMVVACNGHTEVFNKIGRLIYRFHSALPGDGTDTYSMTILDCIYDKKQKTFYILDAMAIGNHSIMECDAEFRFFWLGSKYEELGLDKISGCNEKRFINVGRVDCQDSAAISKAFMRHPQWCQNCPEVDGFLFYHKKGNYVCGRTPLVGWLFPFMVPEVLSYAVNSEYERPVDYVDYRQYIDDFEVRRARKYGGSMTATSEQMDEHNGSGREDEEDTLTALLSAERRLESMDGGGGGVDGC